MRTVKPFLALLLALGCVLGLLAGCDVIPERPTSGDPGRLIGAVSPSGPVSETPVSSSSVTTSPPVSSYTETNKYAFDLDERIPVHEKQVEATVESFSYENAVETPEGMLGVIRTYSNDKGQVRHYSYTPVDSTPGTRLTEEALVQLAENYLADQGIDLTGTTRFVTMPEPESDSMACQMVWNRYVCGGYPTVEGIVMFWCVDGTLIEYGATKWGVLDGVKLPERVDEDLLTSRIAEQVQIVLGDVTYTEDKKRRQITATTDGRPAMSVWIDYVGRPDLFSEKEQEKQGSWPEQYRWKDTLILIVPID